MKIAALIFGALAGFTASLVIALGGMDLSTLAWLDSRQMVMAQFALIFLANLSLLGAGVGLAVPRAGALLLLLSGLAWAAAALLLRHSADAAMLLPSGLALVAAMLAFLSSFLRRRAEQAEIDRAFNEPLENHPPFGATSRLDRNAEPSLAAAGFPQTVMASDPGEDLNPLMGLDERPTIPGLLSGPPVTPRKANKRDEHDNFFVPEPVWDTHRRGGRLAGLANFALYALLTFGAALALFNLYQSNQSAPAPIQIETVAPAPGKTSETVPNPVPSPSASALTTQATPLAPTQSPAAVPNPESAAPAEEARLSANPGLPMVVEPTSEAAPPTPSSSVRNIAQTPPPISTNRVAIPPLPGPSADNAGAAENANSDPAPAEATATEATPAETAPTDPALAAPVPTQMSAAMSLARNRPAATTPAPALSDL